MNEAFLNIELQILYSSRDTHKEVSVRNYKI